MANNYLQVPKPTIICVLNPALFSADGSYRLTVNNNQIRIVAPDLSGLHFAIMTLVQVAQAQWHRVPPKVLLPF